MRSRAPRVVIAVTSLLALGCGDGTAERRARPTADTPSSDTSSSDGVAAAPTRAGFADVGGARHHYQVFGDLGTGKVPLLVLHGSFMSADAMTPLAARFARTRPVIAIDARGHGRTPDIAGPITYELLADDAAGVLGALGVRSADVLGYSMGGITALVMALRHPDRVRKLVPVSAVYSLQGWAPEVRKGFAQWTPNMLAGSGLEAEYKRLSPTPDGLPALVTKMTKLESSPYAWPEDRIRAMAPRTMVVVGDADGVQLDHAVRLFMLRGGGDGDAAVKGYLAGPPRARLAVLPATSHVGMLARAELLVDVVTPFLDDEVPPLPPNFLQPGPARVPPASR